MYVMYVRMCCMYVIKCKAVYCIVCYACMYVMFGMSVVYICMYVMLCMNCTHATSGVYVMYMLCIYVMYGMCEWFCMCVCMYACSVCKV